MASFSVTSVPAGAPEPEPPGAWRFPDIPGAHEPFGPDSRWCRACTRHFEVGVLFPCLTAQRLQHCDHPAAFEEADR